jgi:hypothetical protein
LIKYKSDRWCGKRQHKAWRSIVIGDQGWSRHTENGAGDLTLFHAPTLYQDSTLFTIITALLPSIT